MEVPEGEIEDLLDVTAGLLHQIESGDAEIGRPEFNELRDILRPAEEEVGKFQDYKYP